MDPVRINEEVANGKENAQSIPFEDMLAKMGRFQYRSIVVVSCRVLSMNELEALLLAIHDKIVPLCTRVAPRMHLVKDVDLVHFLEPGPQREAPVFLVVEVQAGNPNATRFGFRFEQTGGHLKHLFVDRIPRLFVVAVFGVDVVLNCIPKRDSIKLPNQSFLFQVQIFPIGQDHVQTSSPALFHCQYRVEEETLCYIRESQSKIGMFSLTYLVGA